ncbi:hypothetical protein Ciccas_007307 [Cichlidogyrus casuarinus]|uniref:Uncharacterized protein n=1 Tax=Cichlidogyrus casuarinus TaxID=1844966 RepID=A0ABD2Q4L3_9PLAT
MCRCASINARLRTEKFAMEYGGFTQPSATTLGGLNNTTWGSGLVAQGATDQGSTLNTRNGSDYLLSNQNHSNNARH